MPARRRTLGWLGALALAALTPAPAHAAGNAYVGTQTGVFEYAVTATHTLSPLGSVPAPGGAAGIVVSPNAANVYATNGDDAVNQYRRDPATGLLTPLSPAAVPALALPRGIAVSPDGRSVYVADQGSNAVSQYDVDPVSGALTPKSPATVFAGPGASDVAVARDGRSAYVTLPLPFHRVDAAVAQFSIDPATGTLSPKNPPAVASGVSPVGVTTSPDGRSVYVANQLGASISQYDTDPLTGALAPKSPAEVPVGLTPLTVAVTPDGLNAYTPNAGFGSGTTVSQLSIDPATGALTPKTPAEVTAGNLPEDLAVAPDGGALYVANGLDNNVSQFAIGATGLLAPLAPATVPTGDAPTAVATTPPPRVPKTKDDCRNGGWRTFGPPPFKNQGDCVSFVATHGRNHPGG